MSSQLDPHISLKAKAKFRVIAGVGLLWFDDLIIFFAAPVVLPAVMEHYGTMAYYAILCGITSLVFCVATPLGGKLGDRFGRRRVCLTAGYARIVLLLLCAIPSNGTLFFCAYISAYLLTGILNAFPATILSDVTTAEERPRWFGLFGAINGAGLLFGLLGGGVIVDCLSPFAAFWIFVLIGVLALLLLSVSYPNCPSAAEMEMDRLGLLSMGAGLSGILMWCSFGDILFPRFSVFGVMLLVIGTGLLVAFVRHENKAKDPLLKLQLFKNRHFTMSFMTHLLIGPMMCLCSSVLVLFGEASLGLSTTVSGTLALPKNILFLLLPSALGAWIAHDQRRFRTAFLMCGGTIMIASLFSATWTPSTSILTVYMGMLLYGVGTSLQSVCVQPYMQLSVQTEDLGIAVAMVQFSNSLGSVVFNAFYNIFYNMKYTQAMAAGGGIHWARAMAEVMSCVSLLSAVSGAVIIVLALHFIPRPTLNPT